MSRPPNTVKFKYNGLTVYAEPFHSFIRFTSNVVKDCLMLVPNKEGSCFSVSKRLPNQQTFYAYVYNGTEDECITYILETLTRRNSSKTRRKERST